MLSKLKKSNNKGFTIIEVMIVLAIAGLIILIVLLAVPALQRNGRNTAIKNDASAVAAAISEYKSNNDGSTPTGISGTGAFTVTGTGSTVDGKLQGSTQVATTPAAIGKIGVTFGGACTGTTPSARTTAVNYVIETSGGTTTKCIDA